MRRVVYVVLDGVGIGALPDAAEYGDEGSDTLGNISRIVGLQLPFLRNLGLGNIAPLAGVPPTPAPRGFVARLAPRSVGKDTTVGHWEQMGLVTSRPFPTYPDGFPPEVINKFAQRIGRGILGNRTASGTQIIALLGDEHVASGKPIVYTSADSVFQVAAHVDVVPLDTLYSWCGIAREMLTGVHGVARVIARPFTGGTGEYVRTPDRRDFSIQPPGPTYLDRLCASGVTVQALGKISEIFAGRGISSSAKGESNKRILALLEDRLQRGSAQTGPEGALIFANLVDFDMVWGHRNDVDAFAEGLAVADVGLARVANMLGPDDRLVITADHGVDPTTPSTDHSREYVPALVYPHLAGVLDGEVYEGDFADAGAFTYEFLTGREADLQGTSFSRLQPPRGWRRPTPTQVTSGGTVAGIPGRVGALEAVAAGRWLRDNLGPAPAVAVVLGSGLSSVNSVVVERELPFGSVPFWRDGAVSGHAYMLAVGKIGNVRCAVLRGRLHEYEGADLSEIQLPIRTLSAWGVSSVLLTTAAGAVTGGLEPGQVLVADRVCDLQYPQSDGRPVLLDTTPGHGAGPWGAPVEEGEAPPALIHASVPGPQYETAAELDILRSAGIATVSMSPAGELRAALDEQMRVAVLAVVTNAGPTTHDDVLHAAAESGKNLDRILTTMCQEWV